MPTPVPQSVQPTPENRGLLQAAKQALAALERYAALPWGQPGYPTHTPSAELIYEARSYLQAAIKRGAVSPSCEKPGDEHADDR